MCGIFGFIGKNNDSFKYGMYGLKQLQNRGYDAAGCCSIHNNELLLSKYASTPTTDSIDRLEQDALLYEHCNNGIYHTRWATHGSKTDNNAHPHMDNTERFAIVHNGIIENYLELKEYLIDLGIVFRSGTDTEVIVNLLSINYDITKCIEDAILKTVNMLRGTWALLILSLDHPDKIYCIRHGSSLLMGLGDNCIMIASEQAGFGNHVVNYTCIDNNNLVTLYIKDNVVMYDSMVGFGKFYDVTLSSTELSPDPYEHWTLKEIHEQYESSLRAINYGGRIDGDKIKLGGLSNHDTELVNAKHLILLGCGTSLNAGMYSKMYFKKLCNFVTVQAFDGSEFTLDDIPKTSDVICVIFLSQSGETKDLYRCLEVCNVAENMDRNIITVGVINAVDSLIAREVNCGCYLNAGREVGVASTKAFTSQIILLSMIAMYISQLHNINNNIRKKMIQSLRKLSFDIKQCLNMINESCDIISDHLINEQHCFILGKPYSNMKYVADEGSLKIKEIGYLHTESYGGKALRHGPYALIEKNTPIIFINPYDNDEGFVHMISTVEEVKSRDATTIMISDSLSYETQNNSKIVLPDTIDTIINVPYNRDYQCILHNIPMQIIAYKLSVKKGNNPDKPRNLSKCISV